MTRKKKDDEAFYSMLDKIDKECDEYAKNPETEDNLSIGEPVRIMTNMLGNGQEGVITDIRTVNSRRWDLHKQDFVSFETKQYIVQIPKGNQLAFKRTELKKDTTLTVTVPLTKFGREIKAFSENGNGNLKDCLKGFVEQYSIDDLIELIAHPETFGDSVPSLWMRLTEYSDDNENTQYTSNEHYQKLQKYGW